MLGNMADSKHTCKCCDPGCPVNHGAKECSLPATFWMKRIDFVGSKFDTPFCQGCCEDALESGVFEAREFRS